MCSFSSGYRPFCKPWWKHWLNPITVAKSAWHQFHYRWQRAQRGWADCDVWNLNNYLASVIPAAIERLRINGCDVPCDENGGPLENWTEILSKIEGGFRAWEREEDMTYENELGKWDESQERFEKCKVLMERDRKLFNEGMELFVKYYDGLWD